MIRSAVASDPGSVTAIPACADLEWATASDIAGVLGVSARSIQSRASRESWPFETKNGNGGAAHVFRVDLLPGDMRARILRAWAAAAVGSDAATEADPAQAERSEKLWKKAGEAVPYRQIEAGRRRLEAVVRAADLAERDRISIRSAAREVATQTGLGVSSIRRWHARCRGWPRRDWLALLVKTRGGGHSKAQVDKRTWSAFLADYLDPAKPRLASAVRRTRRAAKANGWGPLPSESTVRRMVDALPEGAKVLAREGRQAAARMHPTQRIDYSEVPSGHFVSADGLKLDTLWTDWGDGRPINTSTLWAFADIPTSFIMGWDVGPSETTDLVCNALHKLSEGGYVPHECQVDNTRAVSGKELTGGAENRNRFRGKAAGKGKGDGEAEAAKEKQEAEGLLLALGIQPRFTNPDKVFGNPGAKKVERVFGRGGIHESIREDPRLRGKGFSKATAVKGADLIEVIAEAVREWNDRPGRRSQACAGRSCREAFEESFAAHEQRRITPAQRKLLLRRPKRVKVDRRYPQVMISLGTHEYAKPRYWDPRLEEHLGRYVDAWFNPNDLREDITVRDVDGKYICDAAHNGDTVFQDREACREYMRSKHRGLKRKQQQLEDLARMDRAEYEAAWEAALKAEEGSEPRPQPKVVTASFDRRLEVTADGSVARRGEVRRVVNGGGIAADADPLAGYLPQMTEEQYQDGLRRFEEQRRQKRERERGGVDGYE